MTDQEMDEEPAASVEPPAEDQSKSGKKKKESKRKQREAEAEKVLLAELDHLRSLARETIARFGELLETEIVQVRATVSASVGSSDRLARLITMIRALEGLSVKPDKGRRKDLKRIEKLVAVLNRVAQKL